MSTGETKASLEVENARLQSRIAELEAELSEARKAGSEPKRRSESAKLLEDTLDDATDEANLLFRAVAHAFVEQLRTTADVMKSVADEAFKRIEKRESKTDKGGRFRIADIEDDVVAVVNKGIEKSLAAPRRVVDRFHEIYHESASN